MIDFPKHIANVLTLDDCAEREAVLTNLKAGAYTREQDIETDIADLSRRQSSRRAAEAAQ